MSGDIDDALLTAVLLAFEQLLRQFDCHVLSFLPRARAQPVHKLVVVCFKFRFFVDPSKVIRDTHIL